MVAEVLKGLDADPIAKMIEHLTVKKTAAAAPSEDAAPAAEPAAPPAEEDAVAVTAARKSIAVAAAALGPPPSKEMPPSAMRLLLARPKVPAPLDPNFAPVILGKKKYLAAAAGCARSSLNSRKRNPTSGSNSQPASVSKTR